MEFDILELGRLEKARTLIAQNGLPLVKKAQKLRGYTLCKSAETDIMWKCCSEKYYVVAEKEICLNSIWLPLKMENKSSNKYKKTSEWRYLLPANEYVRKQV